MRRVWAGAVAGAGLLLAGGAVYGAAPATATVVSGTAHQALFAVSTHGDAAIAVGAAGAILESADAGKSWKVVRRPHSRPCPIPIAREVATTPI